MFAWFNGKSNYDSCMKNPKHKLTAFSMWARHSHTQLLPINSSWPRWFGDRKSVTIKYWNLKNQVRWDRVTQLSVQVAAKLCNGVRRLIFSDGLDAQHTRDGLWHILKVAWEPRRCCFVVGSSVLVLIKSPWLTTSRTGALRVRKNLGGNAAVEDSELSVEDWNLGQDLQTAVAAW
jgi:hypothetical protein